MTNLSGDDEILSGARAPSASEIRKSSMYWFGYRIRMWIWAQEKSRRLREFITYYYYV